MMPDRRKIKPKPIGTQIMGGGPAAAKRPRILGGVLRPPGPSKRPNMDDSWVLGGVGFHDYINAKLGLRSQVIKLAQTPSKTLSRQPGRVSSLSITATSGL